MTPFHSYSITTGHSTLIIQVEVLMITARMVSSGLEVVALMDSVVEWRSALITFGEQYVTTDGM